MKRIIRQYFIYLLSLYFLTQITKGLVFEKGIYTFFVTAGALASVSLLAKPIINLLLLPLNLVTFGLFRWVASAIVMYITTLVVKDFKVERFIFEGTNTAWFDIPSFNYSGVLAFIAYSFLLSVISSFIFWIRK